MQDQPKQQTPAPADGNGPGGRAGAANAALAGGRRGAEQPPGILFDSDMGRDIDAVLALAVLYSLGAKGKLLAVGVSNSSIEAAAFCDAVGRFYTGDPAAQSTGTRGVLPVGLAESGGKLGDSAMLTRTLAMKKPDGQPLFHHDVQDIADTADVRIIFRNALLTQKDGEGVVVLAGPATDLVRTLALNGGREVVAAKAGLLVVAAGAYPEGPADARIKADVAAARQLFATWPTPIVAVGTEAGSALPYPGRSIESDFTWSAGHPIVEAYRAFRPMPYDAPSQAVIAALYAGNRTEDYFQLSEAGTIQVLDDGRTHFVRSPAGRHRYLIPDLSRKDRIIQAFTALASSKPTPPAGRGGRNPQANQAAPPKQGGRNQPH